MNMVISVIIIGISIAVGIAFARTGVKPEDTFITCPYCGTVIPYREFSKQACPGCLRRVPVSDATVRKKNLQKPSTRFIIGFLISAVILYALAVKLFGIS